MSGEKIDVLTTKPSQAEEIRVAWQKAQYDVSVMSPPGVDKNELARLMESRREQMKASSFGVYEEIKNTYGENDDRARATYIFADLYEDMTNIAISQLDDYDPENRVHRSWREYNESAADGLKDKINGFLVNPEYGNFWEKNPEFQEIMKVVSGELIKESNPEELTEISKKLEGLAINSQEKGRLFTTLFPRSEYYCDSKNSYKSPLYVWEANSQLIFLEQKDTEKRQRIDKLDADAVKRTARLFKIDPESTPA